MLRRLSLPRFMAALAIAALSIARARAELPPQYTRWADFAAVIGQSAIPHLLGTVDRIERTPDGKFIVRAGACFVEVTVIREPPKSPDGKIIVGPSRIARVDVWREALRSIAAPHAGSNPFALNTACASGDIKYFTSAFAASGCAAPV